MLANPGQSGQAALDLVYFYPIDHGMKCVDYRSGKGTSDSIYNCCQHMITTITSQGTDKDRILKELPGFGIGNCA